MFSNQLFLTNNSTFKGMKYDHLKGVSPHAYFQCVVMNNVRNYLNELVTCWTYPFRWWWWPFLRWSRAANWPTTRPSSTPFRAAQSTTSTQIEEAWFELRIKLHVEHFHIINLKNRVSSFNKNQVSFLVEFNNYFFLILLV